MPKTARTIFVFGLYWFAVALQWLLVPNLLLVVVAEVDDLCAVNGFSCP